VALSSTKLKARAIVALRKKKENKQREEIAQKRSEDALIDRLLADLTLPIAKDGKDGRDAPTLSEIVTEILPLLPEPKIEKTTVVQEVNPTDRDVLFSD